MVEAMEIQEGYKQTEVGVIPSDWKAQKLTNIAEICTGSTPPTLDQNNYGDDYYFVTPADLGKGRIIRNTEKKLSLKGFNLSRKYPKNSILFTCIGSTIGKSGIADIELTSNQQINAIFPNKTFNSDYLYYVLNLLANKIKQSAGETAVPIINKTEFGEFPIPLPPAKAEQAAIATALNDADALITQLEKLIAKKRAIKQGAMQELLNGMRRLPNFSDDWITIALGDVGIFKTSSVDKVIVPGEKEVYLLNYMDVYKNSVINKTIITSKTSANNNELQNFNLKRGDIVFTPSSETPDDIGHSAVINEDLPNTLFSYHIVRYRFYDNEFMSHDFKRYVLNNKTVLDYFSQRATGSTRFVLTRKNFNETVVRIPESYEEQTRIAQILSEMDAEIEALKKKLDKHKMLKQGMMQNLLTGRIRLV